MLSQVHYLIRAKTDGQYLVARIPQENKEKLINICYYLKNILRH